eukprot:gnl/MRDRNA2_/MRDRNA2_78119_c0_seq1.p1 gnl/MRDRNA2_/MRDRNA2_78119_c0~~gnl/MRDRNA2_/MRDRNA2_78119_c0_seq1.p1  ORF type:complete len:564 (-),score=83.28 gnl/MRDRNA2_/MRDRNA2_78119_c0_seq1:123-1586(-)
MGEAAIKAGPAVCFSYTFAMLAALCSALCYCEFAGKVPAAGGAYSYALASLGEFPAFLVGWLSIFMYSCIGAALGRGWAGYVTSFLGELGLKLPDWIHNVPIQDPFGSGTLSVNLLSLVYLSALLCLVVAGISKSSFVNQIAVGSKVVALALVVLMGFAHADPSNWTSQGFMPFGVSGVLNGAVVAFFACMGFDAIATTAEEAINPKRNIPLSMILACLVSLALYVSVSMAMTLMVPFSTLGSHAPIADAFTSMGMSWMGLLTSGAACIGLTSGIISALVAAPRIMMCLAREGLVPPMLADVDPQTQTPLLATLVTGGAALVLGSLVKFEVLVSLTSVIMMFVLSTVNISLIALRHHDSPEHSSPPWFTILGFVAAAWTAAVAFNITGTIATVVGSISLVIAAVATIIVWMGLPAAASGDADAFVLPGLAPVALSGTMANIYMTFHSGANLPAILCWVLIGLIVYAAYGVHNSKLAQDAEESRKLIA